MRGWALLGVRSIGTSLTVLAATLALLVFAPPPMASAEVTQSEADALRLSGTLTLPDGTSPANGAQVCAEPLGSEGSLTCAYTDPDGHYALTDAVNGLEATSYRLYADVDTYPRAYYTSTGSTRDRSEATAVDLAATPVRDNLNFSLDAGTGVVGSVSLGLDTTTEVSVQVCPKRTVDAIGCEDVSITGSGEFGFRELMAGDYIVTYEAIGYVTVERLALVGDGVLQLDPVTLSRTEPGNLAGVVVDSQGDPLVDVTVSASNWEGVTSPPATQTDDDGRFSFVDLAADMSWRLDFAKAGYGAAQRTAWLASGATAEVGPVRLAQSASVTVRVQDSSSAVISDAQLTLCTDSYCATPQLDAGNYTFANLNPGRYVLDASGVGYVPVYYPGIADRGAATVIRVSEGSNQTLEPLTMTRPGKLSGTTQSADPDFASLPSTGSVVIYDAAKNSVSSTMISNGAFTSSSLWPGEYFIQTMGVPKFGDSELVPVTVSEGVTTEVGALVVSPNPRVAGAITVGGELVTNSPHISFQGSKGSPFEGLAAGGNFDFRLPADTYSVSVDVNGAHVCGPDQLNPCSPSTIRVGNSDLPQDVSLPGLGTLSGQIDVSEFSSPRLVTSVLDSRGRLVAGGAWTAQSNQVAYQEQLAPGTYTLVVSADDTWTQRYEGLVVSNGVITTQDVMLKKVAVPTFTMSGTVTLPQFESEVTLTVIDVDSGNPVDVIPLLNRGAGPHTYKVSGLPAGAYQLHVQTGDTEVWYPNAELPQWASVIDLTENRTGVNIAVPASRVRVSGTVSLPDGMTKPDGVAYPLVTLNLVSGSTFGSTAVTPDADGHFTTSVPAGVYVPMVENSTALGTLRYLGDPIPLDSDTTVANITLARGGGLHGQVIGSDGIPIADAEITVTADDGGEEYTTTDADGFWRIDGLTEGKAGVKAEADGFATAVAPVEITAGVSANVALTMQAYGRLSVKLSAPTSDHAKTGVTMLVVDADGKQLLRKTLAPNGRVIQIGNLPAGEPLRIGFRGGSIEETWWQGAASVSGATPVTLDASVVTLIAPELDFHLSKGVIAGHIIDNTGTSGHLTVSAIPSGGSDSQRVEVDAGGDFKLLVLPGSYFVKADLCVGLWTTSQKCIGTTRTLWSLTDARTGPELFELAPDGSVDNVDFTFEKWELASTPTPRIGGTAEAGKTLSASVGMWGPAPVALSYQWYRGTHPIAGATEATYQVTAQDSGYRLKVTVTGAKAGFAAITTVSDVTSEVPEVLTPVSGANPKISGTAKVGSRLTAVPGVWSPANVELRYQWYASGVVIPGATSSTFVLTPAQRGKSMTVTVTGWLNGTATITTTSSPTVAVAPGTLSAKTPVISGKAKVGKTLKAKQGTWGPAPVTLRYQWYANGKKISKATKSSYKIAKKYKGKKITVKVTGTKTGYTTVTKKSKATKKVV